MHDANSFYDDSSCCLLPSRSCRRIPLTSLGQSGRLESGQRTLRRVDGIVRTLVLVLVARRSSLDSRSNSDHSDLARTDPRHCTQHPTSSVPGTATLELSAPSCMLVHRMHCKRIDLDATEVEGRTWVPKVAVADFSTFGERRMSIVAARGQQLHNLALFLGHPSSAPSAPAVEVLVARSLRQPLKRWQEHRLMTTPSAALPMLLAQHGTRWHQCQNLWTCRDGVLVPSAGKLS